MVAATISITESRAFPSSSSEETSSTAHRRLLTVLPFLPLAVEPEILNVNILQGKTLIPVVGNVILPFVDTARNIELAYDVGLHVTETLTKSDTSLLEKVGHLLSIKFNEFA